MSYCSTLIINLYKSSGHRHLTQIQRKLKFGYDREISHVGEWELEGEKLSVIDLLSFVFSFSHLSVCLRILQFFPFAHGQSRRAKMRNLALELGR